MNAKADDLKTVRAFIAKGVGTPGCLQAKKACTNLEATNAELLEALKALVKHGSWEWHMRRDECTPEAGEAVKAALAAIARAEGR